MKLRITILLLAAGASASCLCTRELQRSAYRNALRDNPACIFSFLEKPRSSDSQQAVDAYLSSGSGKEAAVGLYMEELQGLDPTLSRRVNLRVSELGADSWVGIWIDESATVWVYIFGAGQSHSAVGSGYPCVSKVAKARKVLLLQNILGRSDVCGVKLPMWPNAELSFVSSKSTVRVPALTLSMPSLLEGEKPDPVWEQYVRVADVADHEGPQPDFVCVIKRSDLEYPVFVKGARQQEVVP